MSGHMNNRYRIALDRQGRGALKYPSRSGSVRMCDINEKLFALYDSTPTITGCAFCSWLFEGTAGEGREQARAHREQEHPEVLLVKSKRRGRRKRTPPRDVR